MGHIYILHKVSSSTRAAAHTYSATGRGHRVKLATHVFAKDLVMLGGLLVFLGLCMMNVLSFIHTDNNILVPSLPSVLSNKLTVGEGSPARILHIVPEYYLLHIYMLVKLIPSAVTCLILIFYTLLALASPMPMPMLGSCRR